MIVEAIFNWFLSALKWILELGPDWTPPDLSAELTAFFDIIGPHGRLLAWLNIYVPMREAVLLLAVGMLLWLGLHGYRFTIYALTKLHVLAGNNE